MSILPTPHRLRHGDNVLVRDQQTGKGGSGMFYIEAEWNPY